MLGFLLVDDDALVVQDDARAQLGADAGVVLGAAIFALEGLSPWEHTDIQAALRAALVDGLGLKARLAFTPVRVAITGRRISPPLFESMELLGRESSLARLSALRMTLGG
jgi:glutamyl-tRNA synthetase